MDGTLLFPQGHRGLFRYSQEEAAAERLEDIEELEWLLGECRTRVTGLEGAAEASLQPADFYRHWVETMRRRLEQFRSHPVDCTMTDFLQAKHEIRAILKQLAGILSSTDWQSPSYTNGPVKEQGDSQKEQNVYLRAGGSELVERYEREFFQEYYGMTAETRTMSLGFAVNSGMKALEVSLMAYRNLAGARLPILYQAGYYYEGVQLIRGLYPDSRAVTLSEIYARLENGEETGCLLLEPGVTWPVHEGIDLERLFAGLSRHRQESPLFVIIDRTLAGIANPLFAAYADRLPEHAVLVSVESAIKYYQYGLELTNLGFAVFCGKRMLDDAVRETVTEFVHMLTGVPDPALVLRLPRPSFERMERRLSRIARNVNVLVEFFNRYVQEGRVSRVFHSVQSGKALYVGDQRWLGSVLYVQVPSCVMYEEYEALAQEWVRLSDPSLHLHFGGSFGFDSMRVNALEGHEGEIDCALRISVGRDTVADLAAKLVFFDHMLRPPEK